MRLARRSSAPAPWAPGGPSASPGQHLGQWDDSSFKEFGDMTPSERQCNLAEHRYEGSLGVACTMGKP